MFKKYYFQNICSKTIHANGIDLFGRLFRTNLLTEHFTSKNECVFFEHEFFFTNIRWQKMNIFFSFHDEHYIAKNKQVFFLDEHCMAKNEHVFFDQLQFFFCEHCVRKKIFSFLNNLFSYRMLRR